MVYVEGNRDENNTLKNSRSRYTHYETQTIL